MNAASLFLMYFRVYIFTFSPLLEGNITELQSTVICTCHPSFLFPSLIYSLAFDQLNYLGHTCLARGEKGTLHCHHSSEWQKCHLAPSDLNHQRTKSHLRTCETRRITSRFDWLASPRAEPLVMKHLNKMDTEKLCQERGEENFFTLLAFLDWWLWGN